MHGCFDELEYHSKPCAVESSYRAPFLNPPLATQNEQKRQQDIARAHEKRRRREARKARAAAAAAAADSDGDGEVAYQYNGVRVSMMADDLLGVKACCCIILLYSFVVSFGMPVFFYAPCGAISRPMKTVSRCTVVCVLGGGRVFYMCYFCEPLGVSLFSRTRFLLCKDELLAYVCAGRAYGRGGEGECYAGNVLQAPSEL